MAETEPLSGGQRYHEPTAESLKQSADSDETTRKNGSDQDNSATKCRVMVSVPKFGNTKPWRADTVRGPLEQWMMMMGFFLPSSNPSALIRLPGGSERQQGLTCTVATCVAAHLPFHRTLSRLESFLVAIPTKFHEPLRWKCNLSLTYPFKWGNEDRRRAKAEK